MATDSDRARAFGSYAAAYDRWRAGYPDPAVDWLLAPGAVRVADLGAGTGKLTGALLARGVQVAAIEPDPEMLDVLVRQHPAAEAHQADAAALPLPDASVDAVLVGQAWHWFPPEAAAEVRRVLRPGGWLGLVWNVPLPRETWELALVELDPDLRGWDPATERTARGGAAAASGLPAAELTEASFPWSWDVTPDDVRGVFGTYSWAALLEPVERERVLTAAAAVVADEAARRGTPSVPWGRSAECVRWVPQTS